MGDFPKASERTAGSRDRFWRNGPGLGIGDEAKTFVWRKPVLRRQLDRLFMIGFAGNGEAGSTDVGSVN